MVSRATRCNMKVLFLQSAHYANDDRVWYHQRAALLEAGCEVDVCGKEELQDKGKFSTITAKADDYQVIISCSVGSPQSQTRQTDLRHHRVVPSTIFTKPNRQEKVFQNAINVLG